MDTIVFDEADALPEVARSVADERIGLDGVAHIAALAGAAASEACRELARLCARETALGRPRLPIRHVDGAPVSDPGHLDYVARAIEAARESGRVLVLCTSYALAEELAARGRDAIVHVRGTRFPLPKSMTRVIGGPDQGLAAKHLDLIHCIPARFRNGPRPAVDRGRIWPLARDT